MTSRSKGEANPLLSAAMAYAERGWFVFPLRPKGKEPLTERGFKDASHDRNEVLRWWQMFPDANIGLATGHTFDVLDIDGPDRVPDLQELLGTDYKHSGPVASTGKGKHLYFATFVGSRNRAGMLGGSLDYRGSGGYVVAPPSTHPSGRHYAWDAGRDFAQPLPVVPEVLTDLIVGSTPRPRRDNGIRRLPLRPGEPETIELVTSGRIAASRPDIIEVAVSLGLDPKPRSHYYQVACPFHPDRTPSMALYPSPQDKFYCYGCGAHGDSHDLAKRTDIDGKTFI